VSLIALEEIGVPFETRVLLRWESEALAAYRRDVNPKGKLPTLVADGRRLTETPAILVWLARHYADARLLPTGEGEAIEALSLMSWFASGIHRAISRARWPKFVNDEPDSFQRTKQMALDELAADFAILETRLRDHEWIFAEWTIIDGYLLWLWFKAVGSGFDPAGFSRLGQHAARCEQRPSVERALDREEAAYAELLPGMPPALAAMDGAVGRSTKLLRDRGGA
jgi:glutathione S-transferase